MLSFSRQQYFIVYFIVYLYEGKMFKFNSPMFAGWTDLYLLKIRKFLHLVVTAQLNLAYWSKYWD